MIFSFLNSWHCAAMCGAMISQQPAKQIKKTLILRLASYTFFGGLLGAFGELLKNSLEYEILGAISFMVFTLISLVLILPYMFPRLKSLSPVKYLANTRSLLWGAIPCHFLGFYYGIAIVSSSIFLGSLILFIHGLMTTPSLLYSLKISQKLNHSPSLLKHLVKLIIILLTFANLYYFWYILIYGKVATEKSLLFCF
jgi:sulfite exporter TauE/SafE